MWDPEAAGNAAKYLRLSDIELLDVRSRPFEGKTSVWIPYADTGYTKAYKMGEKENPKKKGEMGWEVKRLVDEKIKWFNKDQVEPQNPPKYELLEDMANMTYLSEASVVHNLKARVAKKFYSKFHNLV